MKKPIILSAAVLMALPALATAPLWVRDAKISPDGKSIAFTYKGDIFTVPTSGGQATRITSQQSYETTPIWSPDSKTIAFASGILIYLQCKPTVLQINGKGLHSTQHPKSRKLLLPTAIIFSFLRQFKIRQKAQCSLPQG